LTLSVEEFLFGAVLGALKVIASAKAVAGKHKMGQDHGQEQGLFHSLYLLVLRDLEYSPLSTYSHSFMRFFEALRASGTSAHQC
jgi:hypothetical protein